ncbi:hypothetical protein B7C42_08136 [Nocardia cerradoensis]|uniref:Uncharacterized protein n=1 Tax=Nocardia cerradoensis TaxID=85688 RepID=A0A231GT48_9NOCA|nr:hypothetical protein B7C42_08136 [Nocardia cerradoensis]
MVPGERVGSVKEAVMVSPWRVRVIVGSTLAPFIRVTGNETDSRSGVDSSTVG